jgi:hypothetical protein
MPFSLTPRALLRMVIVWTLACLFIAGGIGSLLPIAPIDAAYARWGYPDVLRCFLGLAALAAGLLVTSERTRRFAGAIGAPAMVVALLTLLVHAEIASMAVPVAILIALLACLRLDEKAREVRWECKVF